MKAADLEAAIKDMWELVGPNPLPDTISVVDHGRGCLDALTGQDLKVGDKVWVRLELNGAFVQCRPGVIVDIDESTPEYPICVRFGNGVGGRWEREKVSLDQ